MGSHFAEMYGDDVAGNPRAFHSDESKIPVRRNGQTHEHEKQPRERTLQKTEIPIDDELVPVHFDGAAPEFLVEKIVLVHVPQHFSGVRILHEAKSRPYRIDLLLNNLI